MGELYVTTRFHARSGSEGALRGAVLGILEPVRREPRCLSVLAFRSTDDPRAFFITSRWADAAAYENHHTLPHTADFLHRVQSLIDEPITWARIEPIG